MVFTLTKGVKTSINRLYGEYAVRQKFILFYQEEEFIMNKTELVAAIADQAGLTKKDAEKAVNAFTEVVKKELKKKDGKVQLVGFGTFDVTKRAAREGRNPQTGAKMKIKASKAPRFKAGKALKDKVNKKK